MTTGLVKMITDTLSEQKAILVQRLMQIDTALMVIEDMVAKDLVPQVEVTRPSGTEVEGRHVVRHREMAGTTVHEAAERILVRIGHPISSQELLRHLVRAGVRGKSKNPLNTMNTILSKHEAVFQRTEDGKWGLRQMDFREMN